MKRIFLLCFAGAIFAQTPPVTPNTGLYLPARGSFNWDTWYNSNWSQLDTLVGSVVNVKAKGAAGTGLVDDTTALQAAINAVPTNGGVVFLPPGVYNISASLLITKPVVFQGAGAGGINAGSSGGYDTYTTPTRIVNTSKNTPGIIVQSAGVNTWVAGVVLRDFAIEGNKNVSGASVGDNIQIIGGANSHARHILIESVLSFHAFGAGYLVQDNSYGLTFFHAMAYRNGGSGYSVTSTSVGTPSTVQFTDCWSDLNTTDGLQVSASQPSSININGGFYADSTNGAGIHTTSTTANAQLRIIGASLENNNTAGIYFEGGYGHLVLGNYLPGDSHQLYGIRVDNSAATNYFMTSARIVGNEINTNVTGDIEIGSNAKNTILDWQAQALSHYTITDNGYQTQYPGNTSYLSTGVTTPGTLSLKCSGTPCVTFASTPTAARTITLPDANGTPLYGFGGNITTANGSISSQSVPSGTCVSTGSITVSGYVVGMAVIATPNAEPGPFFAQHLIHFDASHFQVEECNVASTSQTIAAVSFYVRAVQ